MFLANLQITSAKTQATIEEKVADKKSQELAKTVEFINGLMEIQAFELGQMMAELDDIELDFERNVRWNNQVQSQDLPELYKMKMIFNIEAMLKFDSLRQVQ